VHPRSEHQAQRRPFSELDTVHENGFLSAGIDIEKPLVGRDDEARRQREILT